MVIHYNNEDIKELINEDFVVLDFYADWCGPCKMLAPLLEELSNEMNFKLVKIDADTYQDLAREYKVMSIPSVFIYKEGILVNNFIGFKNKEELKGILSRVVEWKTQ